MKNNFGMLDESLVSMNMLGGKKILTEMLILLRQLHKNINNKDLTVEDIPLDIECISSLYDIADIENNNVADDMNIISYHDIPLFTKEDNDSWVELFIKCVALIDVVIQPIIANYIKGNYIIVNYELEKAIKLSSEVCSDLYCILISYPDIIDEKTTKDIFTKYAKFVKYMKYLNNAVVNNCIDKAVAC